MAETLFIGLSIGSILLLVALGLAVTYGAMGVINMAHGELVMLGAYTTVLATKYLHLNFFLCLPLAFVVTGLFGLLIEWAVMRRLYDRLMDTLLATWGVAMLLQHLIRIEFGLAFFGIHVDGLGPGMQNVTIPEALSNVVSIGGITIQPYRTFIILLTVVLVVGMLWMFRYTSFGMRLRAVTHNRNMAACCGVDVQRINSWAFALGSGLAGVAGVMVSGFKTVFPDMGTAYVVDGFLVVVVGGVGSLLGTVGASGLLGETNGVLASVTNDVLARAAVFALVILIIIAKPKGLFSFKGR